MHAARVMAPAPSTSTPSSCNSVRIACLLCSSFTTSTRSLSKLTVYSRTISKEFWPICKFQTGSFSWFWVPSLYCMHPWEQIVHSITRLTVGTRRQSAMEVGFDSAFVGSPALMASVKLGHISDSTACRDSYISCVSSLAVYEWLVPLNVTVWRDFYWSVMAKPQI